METRSLSSAFSSSRRSFLSVTVAVALLAASAISCGGPSAPLPLLEVDRHVAVSGAAVAITMEELATNLHCIGVTSLDSMDAIMPTETGLGVCSMASTELQGRFEVGGDTYVVERTAVRREDGGFGLGDCTRVFERQGPNADFGYWCFLGEPIGG